MLPFPNISTLQLLKALTRIVFLSFIIKLFFFFFLFYISSPKPVGKGESMTSSRCTHRGTTNMSQQRGSGTSTGQGHMSAEAEQELLSLVGLKEAQREFTFTGYTIEEDISECGLSVSCVWAIK